MPPIAPKLPPDRPPRGRGGESESSTLIVDGHRWTLEKHRGLWRIRTRAKGRNVTHGLKTSSLAVARTAARDWLTAAKDGLWTKRGRGSLEALAAVYLDIPKRVSEEAAKSNVSRLRTIVRVATGKTLAETPATAVGPRLWEKYFRAALEPYGRKLDYTTRAAENARLNAAVRAARSVFLAKYASAYSAAGIEVATNAAVATLLPEPWLPRPQADDAGLLAAWPTWRATDPALWVVVGLARFAGLRRREILHCRREWVEEAAGSAVISLRDRPEEGWQTKTGRPYRALVLDPELADFLLAARAGTVYAAGCDEKWCEQHVCPVIRPFTGEASKPLHRLRGLYADQLARDTESAIIARQAGLAAAQQGLGHTSSRTTEKHYLSDAVR